MVGEKMISASITIKENYWENFLIQESDLELLYNHLLENETPLTIQELSVVVVKHRIEIEIKSLEHQQQGTGTIYLPKGQYQIGQKLSFPAFNWQEGSVVGTRTGHNPEVGNFDVIEVEFPGKIVRQFAARLENHVLNQPITIDLNDPGLDPNKVQIKYGEKIANQINAALTANPDLIQIARMWFPRALLVDINAGHLNLAEAILDMSGGGPLPTKTLLEQLEIPPSVNSKLIEFSLNQALHEDGRFDEVGPAGEVLWYLRKLEPEDVQKTPVYLNYYNAEYDRASLLPALKMLGSQIIDELEPEIFPNTGDGDSITFPLIYPHLRAGTLPLVGTIQSIFPTAYQSNRVLFTFVDGDTGKMFNGWVVRPNHYIYGLRQWYQEQKLVPGSLIKIQRSSNPGEVIIRVEKKRSTREWIRTLIVGSDGGIVFAMLKQLIPSSFDERMTIAIPDPDALDQLWKQSQYQRMPISKVIHLMVRELAKLSPQSHVHAQELYAAVNLVKRCPPGMLLSVLFESDWAKHAGDLYFRLDEDVVEVG